MKMIHVSVMYQPMDADGKIRRSNGITYVRPVNDPPRRRMRKQLGISNRSFRRMGLNRRYQ